MNNEYTGDIDRLRNKEKDFEIDGDDNFSLVLSSILDKIFPGARGKLITTDIYTGLLNTVVLRENEERALKDNSLFFCLSGVFTYNKKQYLRLEGSWFEIRDNFIEFLNERFETLVSARVEEPSHFGQWTEKTRAIR